MGKRFREVEDSDAEKSQNTLQPKKKLREGTNASCQRTLFVRSLPSTATSNDLISFFSESYPLKHATVVLDAESKKSKGYGFVTFADTEDAQKAREDLNGTVFLGRKIKIETAEPRSREVVIDDRSSGKKISRISEEAAATKRNRINKLVEMRALPKLIIRNLPWSFKESEQLAQLFGKYGKVKFSTLPKIKESKQAGFGFVTMQSRKSAEKAMASLNNTTIDGRTIAVDWAVEKSVWESQSKKDTKSQDTNSSRVEINKKVNIKEIKQDEKFIDSTANPSSEQENDDVMNFLKNVGHNLESEDESNCDSSLLNDEDTLGLTEDENYDLGWETEDVESPKDKNAIFKHKKVLVPENLTTLFIRNLPFSTLDENLKEKFEKFGPIRYARVVIDNNTGRPKGTGFVCFYRQEDADSCYHGAPRTFKSGANAVKAKISILEDETADKNGLYTIEGRVLQVSRAVNREKAVKLTEAGTNFRTDRDKDKRKLYLLKEGTIAVGTPIYNVLSPSEIKLREASALQRKKLIEKNPALHLSLTRLSIRNIPRNFSSKDLKALARQAVVGFAMDVKSGLRAQLSKEEELRGGEDDRNAEQKRKTQGKGIVRQAKIIFEGPKGSKIAENTGAGKSRGYGFIEYFSHRWALMGLRWMNGHEVKNENGKPQRLVVEFAIENAQVVQRRKMNEEKARLRSLEVLKAREKGELPPKGKKVMRKDQLMAKMRKAKNSKKRKT
ncbi:putative ribosomal processing rna binding nucleolar protein [Erysiphe necator]|uniref:Putative ribosomal processing rna binding nucleolar protein n=1 Tax=Uncinula necator TaxID=52586 RepID=A0A0B1PC56_UNCNE|nr:putative ribosomal processing rna binding nucleolar protein [Erysiphe necator]